MRRTIEQWRNLTTQALRHEQELTALEDAKADIQALYALAERVGRLNPEAGVIGPGMLASLVEQARGLL